MTCNELADKGDFEGITLKINGGLIGLDEREKIFKLAKSVLN